MVLTWNFSWADSTPASSKPQYDFRLDEQDWDKVCWGRLPKAVARSPAHQLSRRAKWAAVLRRAAAPEGGGWVADFKAEDMTPQRLQALARVIDGEFFQGTFHRELARRAGRRMTYCSGDIRELCGDFVPPGDAVMAAAAALAGRCEHGSHAVQLPAASTAAAAAASGPAANPVYAGSPGAAAEAARGPPLAAYGLPTRVLWSPSVQGSAYHHHDHHHYHHYRHHLHRRRRHRAEGHRGWATCQAGGQSCATSVDCPAVATSTSASACGPGSSPAELSLPYGVYGAAVAATSASAATAAAAAPGTPSCTAGSSSSSYRSGCSNGSSSSYSGNEGASGMAEQHRGRWGWLRGWWQRQRQRRPNPGSGDGEALAAALAGAGSTAATAAAPSATYTHSLGRITFWRQVWSSHSPSVGTPMRLDGVACTSRLSWLAHTLGHEMLHALLFSLCGQFAREAPRNMSLEGHGHNFLLLNWYLLGHRGYTYEPRGWRLTPPLPCRL